MHTRLGNLGLALACSTLVALGGAAIASADDALRALVAPLVGANETVYVVDENDHVLLDIGGDRAFTPASILKVFTTLLAAEHLGLDTRFSTEFFRDGDFLVVRGNGDPWLVSEELASVARALGPQLNGKPLQGIVIDNSFFAPGLTIPGVGTTGNPYDAPSAATGVNFNTVSVARRNGKIVSAEAQTPLTPLAESLARQYKVKSVLRINLGNRNGDAARYAGELIAAKLREQGVKLGGRVREGQAPAHPPLYVHRNSRTLANVCQEMLYYSNNYVANQVFLAVGAAIGGTPADLDKSIAVARAYVAAHPELHGISVTEGSGLSYANRVTAPAMAALLKLFAPYKYLLKEKNGVSHKTGTLQGTKTLVGYLDTSTHGTVRFVISLDGPKHDRRWEIVEAVRHAL